jgi:hypothetical protein
VAELYADLTEAARGEGVTLARFATEPGAWWPNGVGGWLKPDAYAVLERPGVRDHWWVEVDLATESVPTVRAKVAIYLDFRRRGQVGPDDLTPWLLVSTVTERRRSGLAAMVRRLPEARDFVTVVVHTDATAQLLKVLRE